MSRSEAINENSDNGYVRFRILKKGIDVTYNPLSTNTKCWPNECL